MYWLRRLDAQQITCIHKIFPYTLIMNWTANPNILGYKIWKILCICIPRVHRFLLSVSLIFLRMTTTILLSESKTGLKLLRFGLNQHRLKKNNHTSSILVCLEMICPSNIKIKPVHPPPQKYFMHHSFSSGLFCFVGSSSLSVIWQDTEEDLSVLEGALQIHRQSLTDRKWSVIVPTMNEEENIIRTLQTVCQVKNEWVKGGGLHDKQMSEG